MPTSTAIYPYNVGGNRGPRHPAHLHLEMVISPVPGALRSTHWASYGRPVAIDKWGRAASAAYCSGWAVVRPAVGVRGSAAAGGGGWVDA